MSPVAVPADRRFRRAHVKPARARRRWQMRAGRLARLGLGGALLLYAVYRGAKVVAQAEVLRIDRIVVHGNARLSSSDVLGMLTGLQGQSLIWTDLASWRHRLLESPWVKDADLRRSLPSTIEIFVSEREPIGIARTDGRMYLVDESGAIIDEYGPQHAEFDLPIIDGLWPPPTVGGPVDGRRMELASRVIAAFRAKPEIARRVSQIDVRDANDAAVILSGDAARIRLGDEQFLQRLQSYLDVASALRERAADIDYVDVRFDGRIYVRPTGAIAKSGVRIAKTGR